MGLMTAGILGALFASVAEYFYLERAHRRPTALSRYIVSASQAKGYAQLSEFSRAGDYDRVKPWLDRHLDTELIAALSTGRRWRRAVQLEH